MHPQSVAAARPLPKRTRSSAGLEDVQDSWPPPSVTLPTGVGVSGPAVAAGRKRHHSLPAAMIASAFPIITSSTNPRPRTDAFDDQHYARGFRTVFTPPAQATAEQPAIITNNLTTNTVTPQRVNSATAVADSLRPPPEMSPREDYLVRAFVSDAMKIDDSISTGTATSRGSHNGASKWTREEDERLRTAVARFGAKNWKMIAESLGHGRTDVQCLHRWNKVLKPGLVKGPWTPEEDRILLNLIARYGVGKIRWCDVALHLPGRIGKQCRERWCNHLDSSIRKGQWTHEEDEAVFRLQQALGNKWSEIAKMLPGRTENAVKNRFNSAARRKWLMSQAKANTTTTTTTTTPSPPQSHSPQQPPGRTTRLSVDTTTHLHPTLRASELMGAPLLAGPPRPPTTNPAIPAVPPRSYSPAVEHQAGFLSVFPVSSFTPLDAASVRDTDLSTSASASGLYSYSSVYNNDFSTPPPPPPGYGYSPLQSVVYTPPGPPPPPPLVYRPQLFPPPPPSATHPPSFASLLHKAKQHSLEPEDAFNDALSVHTEDEDAEGSSYGHAEERQDDEADDQGNQRESANSPSAWHFVSSKSALSKTSIASTEPQTEETEEDRGAEEPRDAQQKQQHLQRTVALTSTSSSTSADMDDQNMSTFLDSVALELDDML